MKIPPLKCKHCDSTHVFNTFTSFRCKECGLVDNKGKRPDHFEKVVVRHPSYPTNSWYWKALNEDSNE